MDFWQAMIWIVGGGVVFVVIRMFWVAIFGSGDTVSSIPPLGSATTSADAEPTAEDDDPDGTWIEIDIEPLFPSSEASVIDLTSEQEPETRP